MLWITPAQFLAHLFVCAVPEAAKVIGDLDGAAAGGEECEGDWGAAGAEAGGFGEAEELLQFGGGDYGAVVAVLQTGTASARQWDRHRRKLVEFSAKREGELDLNLIETSLP